MKPTLTEVARIAGVSPAAVSLVLRDLPQAQRFNEVTRARIKQTAEDLGYRTNFFASQLRQSSSKILMLYVKSLEDTYSASISEAFQRRAQQLNYWTMITVISEQKGSKAFDRKIIGNHGISAIALVAGAADMLSQQVANSLLKENVSLLLIGRSHENSKVSYVQVDDHLGGYTLAEHVFSNGAKTSLIFAQPARDNVSRSSRVHGYLDYIKDNTLPEPLILDIKNHSDPLEIAQEAYKLAKENISADDHPDVIFANTDIRALGIMRALEEMNLLPGKDISLVGYDDIWQSRFLTPPLTTVHQPTEEMGTAAADLLIDIMEGKFQAGRKIMIPPTLVIRESSIVR